MRPMRFRLMALPAALLFLASVPRTGAAQGVTGGGADARIEAPAGAGDGTAAEAAASPVGGPDAGAVGPQEENAPGLPVTALVSTESPRASLQHYLDLSRQGRFEAAARYLDLPEVRSDDGPALARKLKAVLDRHLWFDLERISPEPAGARNDGLPADLEDVGSVPGLTGGEEPVRLSRMEGERGAYWAFSAATVERIEPWYGALKDRWIQDRLPEWALRPGPRDLLWWQWLAMPVLLAVSVLIGRLFGFVTRWILARIADTTDSTWDDAVVARLGAPLSFAWGLVAIFLLVPWLGLYGPAEEFIGELVRVGFFVIFFWTLWRTLDVAGDLILNLPWAKQLPASQSIIPLGTRVSKVAILAMAVIAVLSTLGYPVASLIAGLGIGGLALALAAQKTVENLFGSVSIAVDQPFRVGDFVKVEDFVGTVETIGIRSSRIRTLGRTVISLPNGRLAEMRLETFAARDRFLLELKLGVVYGTTAAQMREIIGEFEKTLREHPKIWPDAVIVRFAEFASSSMDIEVMAWFYAEEWADFTAIRQEILLRFMEIVEAAGSSFAFPTRTIHMVGERSEEKAGEKTRASADGGAPGG